MSETHMYTHSEFWGKVTRINELQAEREQASKDYADLLKDYRALREVVQQWMPVSEAPKGGGAELVTDPEYIKPPKILLLFNGDVASVGYWDAYYAEDGRGYEGGEAWIEPISGERLDLNYGVPIGWKPLPPTALEIGDE
jgi:hypothetical protein